MSLVPNTREYGGNTVLLILTDHVQMQQAQGVQGIHKYLYDVHTSYVLFNFPVYNTQAASVRRPRSTNVSDEQH